MHRSITGVDQHPIDARAGWLLTIAILCVSFYFTAAGESFESRVAWSAVAASAACMICIAATGYRLMSFITMVAAVHMITYPVAAVFNAVLETPAMRPDLWISTDLAMCGCAIGCLSLAGGAILSESFGKKRQRVRALDEIHLTSIRANLVLWSFLLLALLMRIGTGIYDERFVSDPAALMAATGRYHNVLTYVWRIGQIGMFLQLFRYVHTRSQRDLLVLTAMVSTSVLAFLPTGNRMTAFGFVPWLFLFYLSFERRRWRAFLVFLTLVVSFSFLSSVVSSYRGLAQLDSSFTERLGTMRQIAVGEHVEVEESPLSILAQRLADYVSTGRIIHYSPEMLPFRGFDHLDELWMMFVPKLIFTERPDLASLDTEAITAYGVWNPLGGGSSPTMIIGDLYSRWGWTGVVVGMALLGLVLSRMEKFFLKEWDIKSICFYVLYIQTIPLITFSSLFGVIVMLTRELLVCWLLSKFLASLIRPLADYRGGTPATQQA